MNEMNQVPVSDSRLLKGLFVGTILLLAPLLLVFFLQVCSSFFYETKSQKTVQSSATSRPSTRNLDGFTLLP